MGRLISAGSLVLSSAVALGLLSGCLGNDSVDAGQLNQGEGGFAPTTSSSSTSTTDTGTGGEGGEGGSCLTVSGEAHPVTVPVDIIFVIDNSPSMAQEIAAVENNINEHFAAVMDAGNVDYRVIMLSAFGSSSKDQSICISPQLGGNENCLALTKDSEPVETERFFHYDHEIHSTDSWCQMLKTMQGIAPNQKGTSGTTDYPDGWQTKLRKDAFKMVVLFTDDRVRKCFNGNGDAYAHGGNNSDAAKQAAIEFDAHLRGALPEHFGHLDGPRNYRWYTFGGFAPKADEQTPYLPNEPIVEDKTPKLAYNEGRAYQWLSMLTGAPRYSVHSTASYGPIFAEMATDLTKTVAASCTYPLPEAPPKYSAALGTVSVSYQSGDGPTQDFELVESAQQCGEDKFYLLREVVTLCPATCAMVQADDEAKVEITAECIGEIH